MVSDPYQPCPCGAGKKLKFCCCSDILPELDKVMRTLDGEQRIAALDGIDKLLTKYPRRAALLALKSTVQIELKQFEDAYKTAEECLVASPTSSVAHAIKAIYISAFRSAVEALDSLHGALESCGDPVPFLVYQAIGAVGRQLVGDGESLAGRAHIMLQATMAGEGDPQPMQMLQELDRSPQMPLLYKLDARWQKCEANLPWKTEFDEGLRWADEGQWKKSLARFEALNQRAPRDPAILYNLGLLAAFLAKRVDAVSAFRRYATQETVPLDDRVEAEAIAQALDPESYKTRIEQVRITFAVTDADAAQERLLSNPRCERIAGELPPPAENEPPPRCGFQLYDRPVPATSAGLAATDLPELAGVVTLYGKQTDRSARVELETLRNERCDHCRSALAEALGDVLGGVEKEEVVGQVPAAAAVLRLPFRMPDDTPRELRRQWSQDQFRDLMLQRWPKLPLDALGGKTPAESARDPAHPAPVLAAILQLELANQHRLWFDFNDLRRKLGLPTSDPIDPARFDPARIPPPRFHRLRMDKLSDEALRLVMFKSLSYRNEGALRRVVEELKRRPQLHEQLDMALLYGELASLGEDSDEALQYLKLAEKEALSRRRSPAAYLLAELRMRILRLEMDEVTQLIHRIQSQHAREQGVLQSLYSILLEYGLVRPEDLEAAGMRVASAQRGGAAPRPAPAAAAVAPAAAPGGVWSPTAAPAPAAAPSGDKPKLWLPGT